MMSNMIGLDSLAKGGSYLIIIASGMVIVALVMPFLPVAWKWWKKQFEEWCDRS